MAHLYISRIDIQDDEFLGDDRKHLKIGVVYNEKIPDLITFEKIYSD